MTSKAQSLPATGQQLRLTAGTVERGVSLLIIIGVVLAIGFGWWHRGVAGIDPHNGVGYALGIIGGSMMLVLLGYPLRKRLRKSGRKMGTVGFWFRFHMLLGLLGPLAILYHARFSWGALNSAFALGAMVVVSASGLVGRYFYSRVHRGYSDRKLEMRGLKQAMDGLLEEMGRGGIVSHEVISDLHRFEERAVAAGGHFWSSAGAVIGLGIGTRFTERAMLRSQPVLQRSASARGRLHDYFEAVRRAAEFAFYDRLLRLWHLLHLPLFVVLVAAAVLHVVAVHMY